MKAIEGGKDSMARLRNTLLQEFNPVSAKSLISLWESKVHENRKYAEQKETQRECSAAISSGDSASCDEEE